MKQIIFFLDNTCEGKITVKLTVIVEGIPAQELTVRIEMIPAV
jgi:hypothetical protein